jgi:hypothetical protein
MRDVRRYGEELLSERLREGVAQGDLSPDTEVEELAAFFEAVLRGMAVKARYILSTSPIADSPSEPMSRHDQSAHRL